MTTNDTALASRYSAALDEIEQLRAQVMQFAGQLGSAHGERTVLRGRLHDTETELEKVRGQLTAANHHADCSVGQINGLLEYLEESHTLDAADVRNFRIDLTAIRETLTGVSR